LVHVIRTYLELSAPNQFRSGFGHFPDMSLERLPPLALDAYRLCYRAVGAAYHWRDRWDWTDDQIRAHLTDPGITVYAARRQETLAGYYELRRVTDDDSVEVAYSESFQTSAVVRDARREGARSRARLAAYVHARSSECAAQLRGARVRTL
jgi:hypothetical protein